MHLVSTLVLTKIYYNNNLIFFVLLYNIKTNILSIMFYLFSGSKQKKRRVENNSNLLG
jgi:hypothetical protein